MRIMAQSEVPSQPTYVHIAYVAAAATNRVFSWGVMLVLALVILLYQISNKTKLPWRIATLAVTGMLFVPMVVIPAREEYQHQCTVTLARATNLHRLATKLRAKGEIVPARVRELAFFWNTAEERREGSPYDAWRRDFRMTRLVHGGEVDYRFTSAGQDGRFGTEDDITYPTDKNEASHR